MTRDLKQIIDSRQDLLAEEERLKNAIKMRKANISGSFGELRDEINPFSAFSKRVNNDNEGSNGFLSNIGSSPLVSMGVSNAANFLLRKVFLKNAGFLPRLLLPIVVKKASEFIVAPKLNDKLVTGMRTAADKIRETDVEDVLPEAKDLVPDKALKVVAKTSDNIAEKLYNTAEKIRPDERPVTLYNPTLLKKRSDNKIAKKLHKLADAIRG